MARLYADENIPIDVVAILKELGHDVLTAFEAEQANQRISDQNVLLFAIAEGRAVLTLNRHDFVRLHRTNPLHRGIIVCSSDRNVRELAHRIHRTLLGFENIDGVLVRVNQSTA